jgi:nicotinate-nucleotide pyrophosphorylase (carboxylating)
VRRDGLDKLIDLALDEDLGAAGDVTAQALIPVEARGAGDLWAKERMVLAGLGAFARAFERVDASCVIDLQAADGDEVKKGSVVAHVAGPMRSLLIAERTALNLVQRCSGIATLARQASRALRGSRTRVLDTRKTSPGMRALSKAAVRAGGGFNHRFGLFDGVLIKDNHLAAVGGSVAEALRRAKDGAPMLTQIEIEVTSLAQLEEAIANGAQVVLLDNMTDAQVAKAVKLAAGRVELEISGGVTLERLPKLAKLGVDYVSMGALTHSARAMDLSLELRAADSHLPAKR